MRYVILGGGGSFAIHTALYLLSQSSTEEVVSVGRAPLRPEPFSLQVGQGDPRFRYVVAHLTYDHEALLALLYQVCPDVLINFAAQGEGAVSWSESWRFFETNCVGLSRLVEALVGAPWLQRFIQISTSEGYGSVTRPSLETDPLSPSSPYAASKGAFDWYLLSMARVKQFRMNILRPSNCYGPGQLLHRVIPRAVVCGLTGQRLPLQGGGRAEKSFLHSRDLARAIYLVATRAPLGTIYNVGPAQPTAIRDLMHCLAQSMGLSFKQLCEVVEDRPGQDARYWLDSSAIKRDVGWEPGILLDHGLREMVNWGQQYLPILKDWPQTYTLRP